MDELNTQAQQHHQQQHERLYYRESAERPQLLTTLKQWLQQGTYDPATGPHILDVGCGRGWLAQELRRCFPQAVLTGIEINHQACQEAQRTLDSLYEGSVETFLAESPPQTQYDYILLTDVLEHLTNPWTVLTQLKEILKPTGRLAVSLPNIGHYSILLGLFHGRWPYADTGLLDRTHLRFFTMQEARQMFTDTGYHVEDVKFSCSDDIQTVERLADIAVTLGADRNRFMVEAMTFQYFFLLSKKD